MEMSCDKFTTAEDILPTIDGGTQVTGMKDEKSSDESTSFLWNWKVPRAPTKWQKQIVESNGAKPYLGRNDLDLLFNYLLVDSTNTDLRRLWNAAAAQNETEQFLCGLARSLSKSKKLDLRIVRTHENGTKYVTVLDNGFVTTVFDVEI